MSKLASKSARKGQLLGVRQFMRTSVMRQHTSSRNRPIATGHQIPHTFDIAGLGLRLEEVQLIED